MGRIYRLSKKVSDKEASGLKVITKDNQFLDVMSAAVNICNRVADGLELSFARFAV